MAALSSKLFSRCRIILLKCEQFDHHGSLLSVFAIEELAYCKTGLPEVADKSDRVDSTLTYLLGKISKSGQLALPIFLAELRNRYHVGDELHSELESLRSEVVHELGFIEIIDIPFVVAAMTHAEATALFEEAVLHDHSVAQIEYERFRKFNTTLQQHNIVDLILNYGERREDWKPYTYPERSIEDIVFEIIDHVNEIRNEMPGSSQLRVQFLSTDFFQEDPLKRRAAWRQLEQLGGVVLLDAVSLFYPSVLHYLSQSAISSNRRIAILVLSPVNAFAIEVNQLIEELISSQMEWAFSRFDEHLDKLCEIGIGDLRSLQRWLFTILPEEAAIVKNQKPNPINRRILREKMKKEPLGMESIVFGQRGNR